LYFFAENCSDPSKDTNAKVVGDVFSHGNEVKFVCPKDDILIPDSSETLTCNDGKWNGILPSCKGMKDMMHVLENVRPSRTFNLVCSFAKFAKKNHFVLLQTVDRGRVHM
jgi:hypothetical protein